MASGATCSSSPRAPSRSAAPCSSCRKGAPQARGQPGRRRGRPRSRLARTWSAALGVHGLSAGQILVTPRRTPRSGAAISTRASTIAKLLEWRAVPVINENDTVATNEIRYGDKRPPRRPGRDHGQRRPCWCSCPNPSTGLYDAPARHQRGMPSWFRLVERITPEIEGGWRGKRQFGALARRHADQDRGRQDRHHRRHPHGDRVGARIDHPLQAIASGERRRPGS